MISDLTFRNPHSAFHFQQVGPKRFAKSAS